VWQLLLKIIVSTVIIIILIYKIDINCLWRLFKIFNWQYGVLAVASLWVSLWLITIRWQLVLQNFFKQKNQIIYLLKLVNIGFFFNQGLPSTVGGDFYRVWTITKSGLNRQVAIVSVVNDRLLGLVATLMWCFFGGISQWNYLKNTALASVTILTMVMFAGVISVILTFYKIPLSNKYKLITKCKNFSQDLAKIWCKTTIIKMLFVALLSMFFSMLPFYLIALGLGVKLSIVQTLLIVPLVFLAGALPISFAGWGVREGILVFALTFYGVPTEQSLAIAIVFGLAQLIAAIPGFFWYLSLNNNKILAN
jgi:uncharacterized protein (TIRG00374 family)